MSADMTCPVCSAYWHECRCGRKAEACTCGGGFPREVEYDGSRDAAPYVKCEQCGLAAFGDSTRMLASAVRRWNQMQALWRAFERSQRGASL